MKVWRLCKKGHAAFDGEGARLAGGRWNRKGTAMIYTSATLSLAAQELFVHLSADDAPNDLVAVPADIPDDISVTSLGEGDLPGQWRRFPAPETLAEIGTKWVQTMESAVLGVPSAVIPQESNFLLNPAHPDFSKIKIGSPAPFTFDPRKWRKATKLSGA